MDLVSAIRRIEIAHGKVGEFKEKDNDDPLERLLRLMSKPDVKVDKVNKIEESIKRFYGSRIND